MKRCGKAMVLAVVFATLSAGAAVKNSLIRIKVLDAETHSVMIDDSGIPKNCDQVNFDAYCHNSRTAEVTNTLLVQEADKPPYRITCTVDMKFSRCVPLTKGASFDARREKRGLTVYYADDSGKMRKQLYVLAQADGAESVSAPSAGGKSDPAASSSSSVPVAPSAASADPASASTQPAGSSSSSVGQAAVAVPDPQGKVRCSFSSTPAGAEITMDGKYVGSTPSVVNVTAGAHAVVISMPGFAAWKRDLAVTAGSELTVNAVLEKQASH